MRKFGVQRLRVGSTQRFAVETIPVGSGPEYGSTVLDLIDLRGLEPASDSETIDLRGTRVESASKTIDP